MLWGRENFLIIFYDFNNLLGKAGWHDIDCLEDIFVPFLLENILLSDQKLYQFYD